MAEHELILGGARSGKSRCAESRAAAWLATPGHDALLIATALAGDAEMAERIACHRTDRAARLPALATVEVGAELALTITEHAAPHRLLVVDCLTLWLTQLRMPLPALVDPDRPAALADPLAMLADADRHTAALLQALAMAAGPVVLVSNEIGQGVMPMSAEARAFVDALGRLHQQVAALCGRVTLMVAGLELAVKASR